MIITHFTESNEYFCDRNVILGCTMHIVITIRVSTASSLSLVHYKTAMGIRGGKRKERNVGGSKLPKSETSSKM